MRGRRKRKLLLWTAFLDVAARSSGVCNDPPLACAVHTNTQCAWLGSSFTARNRKYGSVKTHAKNENALELAANKPVSEASHRATVKP